MRTKVRVCYFQGNVSTCLSFLCGVCKFTVTRHNSVTRHPTLMARVRCDFSKFCFPYCICSELSLPLSAAAAEQEQEGAEEVAADEALEHGEGAAEAGSSSYGLAQSETEFEYSEQIEQLLEALEAEKDAKAALALAKAAGSEYQKQYGSTSKQSSKRQKVAICMCARTHARTHAHTHAHTHMKRHWPKAVDLHSRPR